MPGFSKLQYSILMGTFDSRDETNILTDWDVRHHSAAGKLPRGRERGSQVQ